LPDPRHALDHSFADGNLGDTIAVPSASTTISLCCRKHCDDKSQSFEIKCLENSEPSPNFQGIAKLAYRVDPCQCGTRSFATELRCAAQDGKRSGAMAHKESQTERTEKS
jgi:hypothetical protein